MSPYLLDTNAWIEYLRGRSPGLRRRVESLRPRDVRLCSVVVAELYYGAYRSSKQVDDLAMVDDLVAAFESFPFNEAAAEAFGKIRADLQAKGTPIGPYDTQIAAIAVANHATLVTHNTGEFARVEGLRIEDWQT